MAVYLEISVSIDKWRWRQPGYWRPVFYILEGHMETIVVNAISLNVMPTQLDDGR